MNSLPPWYRPDQNCTFHQGAPGHDTEQCYPLKEEVQKLIENNIWSFEDPDVKVLLQQQYLASHSVAAVRPIINTVKNPGFQPHFQQCQQQYLQSPQLQALQQPISQSQASGQPQFDLIPMKYAELLPGLLKKNLIQTRPPPRGPKK